MKFLKMLIWIKVFKNEPTKICGIQTLKNFIYMVCVLNRPYNFKYFKDCLSPILLVSSSDFATLAIAFTARNAQKQECNSR